VRKVEAKLNFDATPIEHQVVAVDVSVVRCGGRPIYVWVSVDIFTKQPVWFAASLAGTTENALRFLRRRRRCLHVWATQSYSRIGVRGTVRL